MSVVEHIEQQIASLNQAELKAFREWFARYDADDWDIQIESDAASGKLDGLLSGRSEITQTEIPENCEALRRTRVSVQL